MLELKDILTLAVAVVAILFGIRGIGRQLSAQSFISYANKFDGLDIHDFDEWRRREEIEFSSVKDNKKLDKALNGYLHLCCQQYYLLQKRMITGDVWDIWEKEIESNLHSMLVATYWKDQMAEYFEFYPKFKKYVDCIQSKESKVCIGWYNKLLQRTLRFASRP